MRSVLASWPRERAKSRGKRGLTTLTTTPAWCRAATNALWYGPVASQTTWIGPGLLRKTLSNALKPAGVLGMEAGTAKWGQPRSRVGLETSAPR
jgi:hypothetical protein